MCVYFLNENTAFDYLSIIASVVVVLVIIASVVVLSVS